MCFCRKSVRLFLTSHVSVCCVQCVYSRSKNPIFSSLPTTDVNATCKKRFFSSGRETSVNRRSASSNSGIPVFLVSSVTQTRIALQWILAFCAADSSTSASPAPASTPPAAGITAATRVATAEAPSIAAAAFPPIAAAASAVIQEVGAAATAVLSKTTTPPAPVATTASREASAAAPGGRPAFLAPQRCRVDNTSSFARVAGPLPFPALPLLLHLPFTRVTQALFLHRSAADSLASSVSSPVSPPAYASSSKFDFPHSCTAAASAAAADSTVATRSVKERSASAASGASNAAAGGLSSQRAGAGAGAAANALYFAGVSDSIPGVSQAVPTPRICFPSILPPTNPVAAITSASGASTAACAASHAAVFTPASAAPVDVPSSDATRAAFSSFSAAAVNLPSIQPAYQCTAATPSPACLPLAPFGIPEVHYTDVLASAPETTNSLHEHFPPTYFNSPSFPRSAILSFPSSSALCRSHAFPPAAGEALRLLRSAVGVYVHPACSPLSSLSHPLASTVSSSSIPLSFVSNSSSRTSSPFAATSKARNLEQTPTWMLAAASGAPLAAAAAPGTAAHVAAAPQGREATRSTGTGRTAEQTQRCLPRAEQDSRKLLTDLASPCSPNSAGLRSFFSLQHASLGRFGYLSTLFLTTPAAVFLIIFPACSSPSSSYPSPSSPLSSRLCAPNSASAFELAAVGSAAGSAPAASLPSTSAFFSAAAAGSDAPAFDGAAYSTEHEAMATLLGAFLFRNSSIMKVLHNGSALLSTLLWQYNIYCCNVVDLRAAAALLLERDSVTAADEMTSSLSLASLLAWRFPKVAKKLHKLQLKIEQQQQQQQQGRQHGEELQHRQKHDCSSPSLLHHQGGRHTEQQQVAHCLDWHAQEPLQHENLSGVDTKEQPLKEVVMVDVQEETLRQTRRRGWRQRSRAEVQQTKRQQHRQTGREKQEQLEAEKLGQKSGEQKRVGGEQWEHLPTWRGEKGQQSAVTELLRISGMLQRKIEIEELLLHEGLMAAHMLPLLLDICVALNDTEAEFIRERSAVTTVRAASLNSFFSSKPKLSSAALQTAAAAAAVLLQQAGTELQQQQQTVGQQLQQFCQERGNNRRRISTTGEMTSSSGTSSSGSLSCFRGFPKDVDREAAPQQLYEIRSSREEKLQEISVAAASAVAPAAPAPLTASVSAAATLTAAAEATRAGVPKTASAGSAAAARASPAAGGPMPAFVEKSAFAEAFTEEKRGEAAAWAAEGDVVAKAAAGKTKTTSATTVEAAGAGSHHENAYLGQVGSSFTLPNDVLVVLRSNWKAVAAVTAGGDGQQEREPGRLLMEPQKGMQLEAMLLQRASGGLLLFDINCGFLVGVAAGAAAARPFADLLPGDVTLCCVSGRSNCGLYVFLQRVGGDQLVYDLRSKSMLPLPSTPSLDSCLSSLHSDASSAVTTAASGRGGAMPSTTPAVAVAAAGGSGREVQGWRPVKLTSNASLVNSTEGFTLGLDEKLMRRSPYGSSGGDSGRGSRSWDGGGNVKPYVGQRIRVPGKRGAIKIRKKLPKSVYDDNGRSS